MKRIFALALTFALTLCTLGALTSCGGAKFDENKNISVVTREDGSGTKSAFMEIIGLKGKSDVSGVIIGSSTAAVLNEVKSNPHAIGYDSLGYITDDVKMLKVDGVEATVENIKNDNCSFGIVDGNIVCGNETKSIILYTTDGRLIRRACGNYLSINGLTSGLYIIVTSEDNNAKAYKISIK